jgi:hypothetical protein
VEKVHVSCIRIVRVIFEDPFGDIVKNASSLHNHDARSDFVRCIRGGKLLNSQRSESMYPRSRHGSVPPAANVIAEGIESLCRSPGGIPQPPAPITDGS